MPDLTTAVLAGFGSALVVFAGYHLLVARPRLRRLGKLLAAPEAAADGGGGDAAAARVPIRVTGREFAALTARIEALEKVARSATPHIGFVRFNALDDVGSDQSYALALVTREGDGVVLSSIYTREETRTYGKAVRKFQTPQESSDEERSAIALAKAAAS